MFFAQAATLQDHVTHVFPAPAAMNFQDLQQCSPQLSSRVSETSAVAQRDRTFSHFRSHVRPGRILRAGRDRPGHPDVASRRAGVGQPSVAALRGIGLPARFASTRCYRCGQRSERHRRPERHGAWRARSSRSAGPVRSDAPLDLGPGALRALLAPEAHGGGGLCAPGTADTV